jgi:nucleolar protein 15
MPHLKMAPESIKNNKRKGKCAIRSIAVAELNETIGAVEATPKPKKQKKSDDTAAANKSSAKALNAAVAPIDDVAPPTKGYKAARTGTSSLPSNTGGSAKTGKNNKRAIEDAVAAPEASKTPKEKKSKAKKAKKSEEVEDDDTKNDETAEAITATPAERTKQGKTANKQRDQLNEPTPDPIEVHSDEVDGEEDDGDEDDQTAALLAGFESDRDESDLEKEDEAFSEESIKAKIPQKVSKQLKKVSANEEEPGVIYVGSVNTLRLVQNTVLTVTIAAFLMASSNHK